MNGEKIRLSKSSISQAEKDAVARVLDTEFLGMGEEVKVFEENIQAYLESDKSVVCVSTGTSALHLTLSVLGLKEGDEVIVPSLTYVASYQAISATGATPVSCEVDLDTLFIDVNDAEAKISKNTKVIMPVHYASASRGMEDVYILAKKYNLRVVEDAAQAFGSSRNGKKVGQVGDILCFSFDGIKNITSGEGGAIVSSDNTFIQKVKDARLLGVEKDTENRFLGLRTWDFDVHEQGFRYHMSNIMAAIGIVQLTRIEEFKNKRLSIVKQYVEGLREIDAIKFMKFDLKETMSHIFIIKTERRDELREYLLNHNIECGVHYKPNHLLTKYTISHSLPITESLYKVILTLPCHFDLSLDEQNIVINRIKSFFND